MQRKSSTTVKVYSIDRKGILNNLSKLSEDLLFNNRNVLRVILFGSLAKGDYSPHSDIDLLITLANDKRRRMDRIPEFILHFLPVGFPVDVFPLTIKEIEEMRESLFLKEVNRNGIILAQRKCKTSNH